MRPIQMVDLLGQYDKIQEEIDQAVTDVIRSSAYINGPEVKAFQKELEEYLDVAHVIPCANGTDALQLCMMALDLKPGDEVITASFTYVATAEVIALLGLTPVLVDVDPDTFNIDLDAIKDAITEKTKAIVPVHLFGQCADMEPLMTLAQEHGLYVIEDTAQAIGSTYTYANGTSRKGGCMGDFGTTSFFPSKNLGCFGDGGAIFTNDDDLASKARMMANHGQTKRYYHDMIGVNSRLDSIQAAILRIKLRHLDDYIAARQRAAEYYDERFASVERILTPVRASNSDHVFHQYTLKTNGTSRDEIVEHLTNKGLPAMIYYPVPLHMQKAYLDPRYSEGMFPVTENLCERVFSLPMHTELTHEQQDLLVDSVLEAIS
ncbi:MAG: DegT/DnrJ/EryC1/StrS family aminotransferase [Flavobacteriales bacterium]|nr:DegT/DnrJ/EryC1/StrS family aminotransferase [Flavobacteriales bacterium]